MGNPPYGQWQHTNPDVRLVQFAEAAAHGEIVLNALNGANALTALQSIGAPAFAGRILLDLALPLDFSEGLPPTPLIANTDSLGEQIQRAFPDARVVKSLNTVYMAVMVDPGRLSGDHTLFLSGNDHEAKQTVRGLLREFGWKTGQVIDLGGIESARSVEMYSALFFSLYGVLGTFDFNIAVTRG